MNDQAQKVLEELIERYPVLKAVQPEIREAAEMLIAAYREQHKLMIAGNGGSCADSEHIVGELMKGFCKCRPLPAELKAALQNADPVLGKALSEGLQMGLPAIALTGHTALNTAFANDADGVNSFAQQLINYGRPQDVFLGISTSGNSENIVRAAVAARACGVHVITLTGRDGGRLKAISDICIIVPEHETFKIQELHLPVYHALCRMLEETFYTE